MQHAGWRLAVPEQTCLTATPSAKASTLDSVTRLPRASEAAIAFAPAQASALLNTPHFASHPT